MEDGLMTALAVAAGGIIVLMLIAKGIMAALKFALTLVVLGGIALYTGILPEEQAEQLQNTVSTVNTEALVNEVSENVAKAFGDGIEKE